MFIVVDENNRVMGKDGIFRSQTGEETRCFDKIGETWEYCGEKRKPMLKSIWERITHGTERK